MAGGASFDEFDEVVMEVPIFRSTEIEDKLWVFRYPLVPKSMLKGACTIKKAFFKPNNEMGRLEIENGVYQSTFEEDRALSIAEEVDGPPDNRRSDKVVFENSIANKTILNVVKKNCDEAVQRKNALMIYDGRAVHLAQVKGVMEFERDHSYLNQGARKSKKDKNRNDPSDVEDLSEARQVTVKFKQGLSDTQRTNTSSYYAIKKQREAEQWIPCSYQTVDSVASKVQRTMFYSAPEMQPRWAPCKTNISKMDYINNFIPPPETQKFTNTSNVSGNALSRHDLRQLPVPEQCKMLLKNVNSMAFQQIMITLAGDGMTADLLLKTLPQVAVLVCGNWVVKSEILYPADTHSAISGVPAENMCRARDYMLYLFTKNQYVERKKIASLMKIPSEELEDIFKGISRQRYNKGWELSSPPDHEFIMKHADIVARQNEFWEERFRQISDYLKLDTKRQRRKSKSVSEDPTAAAGTSTGATPVQRVRTGPSMSSDNDSGTDKKDKGSSPKASKKKRKVKISISENDNNSS